MFSTDRALFDADSSVRTRLLEQAALVTSIDVVVFTPVGEKFRQIKEGKKLTIHPTQSSSAFLFLPDAYRIGKGLLGDETERNKWLITTQDPFMVGAVGYVLSRICKVPLHVQLHTDPWNKEWQRERLRNKLELMIAHFLLTRADGVRVVSERVRRAVLALGVEEKKVTKFPIWVDVKKWDGGIPSFDLHRSYPEFAHIILSIGRLQPEKNYFKLIKVFAQVARVHDDAMLLIVGSGPERERLIILSRSLGIEKSVVLLPWARDVVSYYKTSDIYVQPSLYEGWGLAVIEAMASGLPVVMTDVGCAGEVVRNGETGIVVPTGDEQALLAALHRLLEDRTLRATLSKNGKAEMSKLATEQETLELYYESWQRAYGKTEPVKKQKNVTRNRSKKTKKKQ